MTRFSFQINEAVQRGQARLAEVRRNVWPEYNGEMCPEPTNAEFMRYVEELESAVAGEAIAVYLAADVLTRRRNA